MSVLFIFSKHQLLVLLISSNCFFIPCFLYFCSNFYDLLPSANFGLHNKGRHCHEKPHAPQLESKPPLTATRESPSTSKKTQDAKNKMFKKALAEENINKETNIN